MTLSPLPIDNHLANIVGQLLTNGVIVVSAEPGAGKTTRLPPAVLAAVSGQVLVLEPRRLAVKLSAERVAEELQSPLGQLVGYRMRDDSQVSAATRLCFVTEGVLGRMIYADPWLQGVSALIIDEFHERHILTDFALAYGRFLRQRRPDLHLVVMSATIDTQSLGRVLGAPVVKVPGRTFPITIHYRPYFHGQDELAHLGKVIQEALAQGSACGHILVFFAGLAAIRMAESYLRPLFPDCLVCPLSAGVSAQEQHRALAASSQTKIILATNVAETSLTLDGVATVIDLGRAKVASLALWSGLTTLDVKRISQAAATQRAGRAGRTAPGTCYRLYDEQDLQRRDQHHEPEVQRLDLTALLLDLGALRHQLLAAGETDVAASEVMLPFLDPLPMPLVMRAQEALRQIAAIDAAQQLTSLGLAVMAVPLHPRYGALLCHCRDAGMEHLGPLAAALLSEGGFVSRLDAADKGNCDILYQLGLLAAWQQGELPGFRQRLLDRGKMQRIWTLAKRLAGPKAGRLQAATAVKEGARQAWQQVLLAVFADRLAVLRPAPKPRREPNRPAYNLCQGRGGVLHESSVVAAAPFIVALDAFESQDRRNQATGTQIFLAAAIERKELLAAHPYNRREDVRLDWDPKKQAVAKVSRVYYDQIIVGETPMPLEPSDAEAVHDLLLKALQKSWPQPFADHEALARYHHKLELLAAVGIPHDLPQFVGDILELWQHTLTEGATGFGDLAAVDLAASLQAQLSYAQQALLAQCLPEAIMVADRRFAITYAPDSTPKISGRIQWFFGVRQHPAIAEGRLPLLVELLAPNQRPAQLTTDLLGFWRGSYPEIRKELARRYPKHHWPLDPQEPAEG